MHGRAARRLQYGRSMRRAPAAGRSAGARAPASSRSRVTRPRWPRYGSRSSSIRSSVPRGSRASAQQTMFGMWKSPTLTASGSPKARKPDLGRRPRPDARERPQRGVGRRQRGPARCAGRGFRRRDRQALEPRRLASDGADELGAAALEAEGWNAW